TVGGPTSAAGNIISGNAGGAQLFVSGTSPVIQGNYVGTDATGSAALGGGTNDGIAVTNAYNPKVGGNVVSGNYYGVEVGNSALALVQGNRIGTDATGTYGLGNHAGIYSFGDAVLIGGPGAGEGNLISGNELGIFSGNGNTIQGNLIGT